MDSPICSLCNRVEEMISDMFWDCQEIQDYWFDIQGWLHANFCCCRKILLSRELIILGSKVNTVTDRIFYLFMLFASTVSSLQDRKPPTAPHLNVYTEA